MLTSLVLTSTASRRGLVAVLAVGLLGIVTVLVPVLVMRGGTALPVQSRPVAQLPVPSEGPPRGAPAPAPTTAVPTPAPSRPASAAAPVPDSATILPQPNTLPPAPVPASTLSPSPVRTVPSGRVGAWPMAGPEGTAIGTVADVSGRRRPLVARGVARYTAGPDGRAAAALDGGTGYLSTAGPVIDTRGSYTVGAWVRLDRQPTSFVTAVSQDAGDRSAFFLQWSAAGNGFAFSNPTSRVTDPRPVRVGTWYHLTGVYDASRTLLQLYVNGTLAADVLAPSSVPATGPLQVGRARWNGAPVDWWPGAVGTVQAYARALTPTEVLALSRRSAPV